MSRTPTITFATGALRALGCALRNPALGIGILTLSLAACGSSEDPFVDSDTGLLDAGSDAVADTGSDTGADTDVGICDGPNPAGCNADSDCPTDSFCQAGDELDCRPSTCSCEPDSGWMCTADCGGGVCTPSAGGCASDSQCSFGAEWCVDGACEECDNSAMLCDISCEEGFGLPDARNGCTPCECVPISACDGPNPAGCSATGCPSGQACIPSATTECIPSNCFCAEDGGGWTCTDDCSGGGSCMPVDVGECDTDDDCAIGELCDGSECFEASCDLVYAPVCGVDGETYGNECEASINHVEIAYEGECASGDCVADSECPVGQLCIDGACEGFGCTEEYDPVCGVDGNTYGNACEAGLAHVEIAYEGECEGGAECDSSNDCAPGQSCIDGVCEGVDCPAVYHPVCGVDGNTYGNDCEARAAGVEIAYEGECDRNACEADDDCPPGQGCFDGVCEGIGCPDIYRPVCGVDGQTYGNECEANAARVEIAYEGECEPSTTGVDCGTAGTCARDEYCNVGHGGAAGSESSYSCLALPDICVDRPTCECVMPEPRPESECSEDEHGVTISTFFP